MQTNNKKLLYIMIPSLLLVVAGLVLAWWLLWRTPGNAVDIYGQGMKGMGAGLGRVADSDFIESISASEFEGNLTVTLPPALLETSSQSLSFPGCQLIGESSQLQISGSDTSTGSSQLEADWRVDGQTAFGIDFKAIAAEGNVLPDIYFRLDQTDCTRVIQQLLAGSTTGLNSNLDSLFGTWWFFDEQTLIDAGLFSQSELDNLISAWQDGLLTGVTEEDYQDLLDAWVDTAREYVFTDNANRMVFQLDVSSKENVQFKGQATEKYDVLLNKQNMNAFLKQLRADYFASSFHQKLLQKAEGDSSFNYDASENDIPDEDIAELVDDLAEAIKIEAWLDRENGVLRNLRFSDKDASASTQSYVDVGFVLGDDTVDFNIDFVSLKDGQEEISLRHNFKINSRNNEVGLKFVYEFDIPLAGGPLVLDFDFKVVAKENVPALQPPADYRPLTELLEDLGVQNLGSRASQTERLSAVASLQAEMATYAANHGGQLPEDLDDFFQTVHQPLDSVYSEYQFRYFTELPATDTRLGDLEIHIYKGFACSSGETSSDQYANTLLAPSSASHYAVIYLIESGPNCVDGL